MNFQTRTGAGRKANMKTMDGKYQIDTKENAEFLKEVREGLLNFGPRFS